MKYNAHGYYCKKTGYLLGFRQKECREQKRQSTEMTVLFHDGSKFDYRLIIKYLAKQCSTSNFSFVGHSKETFLTFTISEFNNTNINVKFIDSIKHFPYPLEKLVNYLSNNYKHTEI